MEIDTEETVYIPIKQKLKDELDANRTYLSYDQYINDLLMFYTKPAHETSREI